MISNRISEYMPENSEEKRREPEMQPQILYRYPSILYVFSICFAIVAGSRLGWLFVDTLIWLFN